MDTDLELQPKLVLRRVALVLIGAAAGGITGIAFGWAGYLRTAILFFCTLGMLAVLEEARIRSLWAAAAGGVFAGLLAGGTIILLNLNATPLYPQTEWLPLLLHTSYYGIGFLVVYKKSRKSFWKILSMILIFWIGYAGSVIWHGSGNENISIILLVLGLSFLNGLVFTLFWYTFAMMISDTDRRAGLKLFMKSLNKKGEGLC